LIIATGVAGGGSVLFLASILELIGKGKVIGIEVDMRAHNTSICRFPTGFGKCWSVYHCHVELTGEGEEVDHVSDAVREVAGT
jgi:cephalosporin hydroxylase